MNDLNGNSPQASVDSTSRGKSALLISADGDGLTDLLPTGDRQGAGNRPHCGAGVRDDPVRLAQLVVRAHHHI